MPKNNSTPEAKEVVNERIRMSVRHRLQPRAITIDATSEFLTLCAQYKIEPEDLIMSFMEDITLDNGAPYDPYAALFHQAARNYLTVAHGATRIIQGGKYTERPAQRTFK